MGGLEKNLLVGTCTYRTSPQEECYEYMGPSEVFISRPITSVVFIFISCKSSQNMFYIYREIIINFPCCLIQILTGKLKFNVLNY